MVEVGPEVKRCEEMGRGKFGEPEFEDVAVEIVDVEIGAGVDGEGAGPSLGSSLTNRLM